MTGKVLLWRCPVCGSVHYSDWTLSMHIAGMAITYGDSHKEWALSREPDLHIPSEYGDNIIVAKRIRPLVQAEVRPRRPSETPYLSDLSDSDLVLNLAKGYTFLAQAELLLHSFILKRLKDAYGNELWWTQGVPRSLCG